MSSREFLHFLAGGARSKKDASLQGLRGKRAKRKRRGVDEGYLQEEHCHWAYGLGGNYWREKSIIPKFNQY